MVTLLMFPFNLPIILSLAWILSPEKLKVLKKGSKPCLLPLLLWPSISAKHALVFGGWGGLQPARTTFACLETTHKEA